MNVGFNEYFIFTNGRPRRGNLLASKFSEPIKESPMI